MRIHTLNCYYLVPCHFKKNKIESHILKSQKMILDSNFEYTHASIDTNYVKYFEHLRSKVYLLGQMV